MVNGTFLYRSTGKNLPGHYGQQDLSADAAAGRFDV